MDSKIFLVLFVLIAVAKTSTGLKCYACSSSPSIYSRDCDLGTPNVRYGTCPTKKKYYCITRRTNDANGNSTVLRDCSSNPTSKDYSCSSDYCNPATTTRPHIWIWTFGLLVVSFFSKIENFI
ncbi:uncharacterized protein LOC124344249 [Daphnia pulicaria]|uniref:uncharacterized protein LOC124344249 n=1 Tax=Daphnia pulicaria TaxID=35523 RepID=UPI001EEABFBA|nr:uncharacterized protein LOC124344249 [Daphnia pulicaria]